MPLNEYFEKMNKYKKKCINEDICIEHSSNKNNKYVSYCFECNRHLCKECLKTRDHINHKKNNILEIKPIKEELNLIEEIIKYFKKTIEILKNEKVNKIKELENMLNINKKKENQKIKEKIEIIKQERNEELLLNYNNYKVDIKEIKLKYEKEIKDRINKYKIEQNKIKNKYKNREEKEYIIHKLKIEQIFDKYNNHIEILKNDKKIEYLSNIKKITEIINISITYMMIIITIQ